jgi:hypothetical protein
MNIFKTWHWLADVGFVVAALKLIDKTKARFPLVSFIDTLSVVYS